MMAQSRWSPLLRLILSIPLCALLAAPAFGQIVKRGNDVLSSLTFAHEKLQAAEQIEPLDDVRAVTAKSLQDGWEAFRLGAGAGLKAEWQASIDKRTGLVAFAEGGGIAWVPGHGNALAVKDLDAYRKDKPAVDLERLDLEVLDLQVLDAIARDFLPRVQSLLGVDPAQLVLNRARSGQPAGHVWFVDYDVVREGMAIEGARVVFRVNNGNLIQYGTENLPSLSARVPATKLTGAQARAVVARYIGGFQAGDTMRADDGPHLVPAAILSARSADGYDFGNGRGLTKVWRITFKRRDVMGTWQAQIDATTGELLSFEDVNEYAQALVSGGVFLNSPLTGAEVVRPFPDFGLSVVTAAAGNGLYTYPGGTVTGTFSGKFVRITDSCGSVSQASGPFGDIFFGTSPVLADCATPGHGGAGNTHAAREQLYQVARLKGIVRSWLPANTWLNGLLNVNVNLSQTCNAYWDGTSLNFYKAGGGCANSGQIAGISLHELGQGIDQNDGSGVSPDGATGESYGDTTALLALHDSCIGEGFLSSNCVGYGDACTACTGVRDADWNQHASHTPATPDNFIRVHCAAASGTGPCGKEAHCESSIPTETMWDLGARDLPGAGTGAAWTVLDRLWYLSRATATQSFSCTAGTTYVSNGCGTGSLWKVFRAIDDDDGNLNNGTPHGGALYAAFNRHGIACTTDPGASTTFAGCAPPATPTLSASPTSTAVSLSWTASGSAVYDLFRSDLGCDGEFTRIGNAVGGSTFNDPTVVDGYAYSYRIAALPSGNEACSSPLSACVTVTPPPSACTPPAAPSGLAVTSATATAINLSWSAVAGATAYNVYRATTSTGPYVLAGTTALTGFSDAGLACSTGTFYVVRATASSAASPCESASSAQVPASTASCACTTHTLYSNTFDTATGLSDWTLGTYATGGSTASWRGVQACAPTHSGANIFRYGGTTCTAAYGLSEFGYAQPRGATGITVPTGATGNRLSFWHRRGFESGYDGGTLTLSLNGTTFYYIPATAILSGSTYNGTIGTACPPPSTAGVAVFTGASATMTNTTVDLDAACNAVPGNTTGCAGRTIHIGFTSITDCSLTSTGWFLDDVSVTGCY
jgi:trimeric autotransporter adhesin